MKISSFQRIDDNSYAFKMEKCNTNIIVHTAKDMDKEEAFKVVKALFSSYSETEFNKLIDTGTSNVKLLDHFYSLSPTSKMIKSIAHKTFHFIREPSRNLNYLELNLTEIPAMRWGLRNRSVDLPVKEQKGANIYKKQMPYDALPEKSLARRNVLQGFFTDPFTVLSKEAYQVHIKNFSQQDTEEASKGDSSLQIRELKNVKGHSAFVLTTVHRDEAEYLPNKETVKKYQQMLLRNYGAEKLAYIEHRYGINLQAMIEENIPLTPAIVYKMNMGVGGVEIQDVEALLQKLKELPSLLEGHQGDMSLSQWCLKEQSLPLHIACGLARQVHKENGSPATVADLQKWLTSAQMQNTLAANSAKNLDAEALNTLMAVLSFTPEESESQYTGCKIHKAIQSGYTIGGKTQFKPWLEQQELMQVCQQIKGNKSWDFFKEILAHAISKTHLVQPHPTEGFRLGMLIPAPPSDEGKERWYRVSSCINNSAGNVSYTLEPACQDDSLPAIKLFRSTASSPYAWDGLASMENDLNPLNPAGYEGNARVEGYEEPFFKSRTIPLWVGYQLFAKELLEKENRGPEDYKDIAKHLADANKALVEEFHSYRQLSSFDQLVSRYDHAILALFSECQKESRILDKNKLQFVKLLLDYRTTPEEKVSYSVDKQKEDAAFLKKMILNYPLNEERLQLLQQIEGNVLQPEKTIKRYQKELTEFNEKIYNELEKKNRSLDDILQNGDPIEVEQALQEWSAALHNVAHSLEELPEQKIAQDVEIIGHSLGGALGQRCMAHNTLLQGRIPVPGKNIRLHSLDAPGIRHKEASSFMEKGAQHSELLRHFNQPLAVSLDFEAADFVGFGGQTHLGGTPPPSKGEVKGGEDRDQNWLTFNAAVQKPLSSAKALGISDAATAHATQFKGGRRVSALTEGKWPLSTDERKLGDFERVWLSSKALGAFDQRARNENWQEFKKVWNVDSASLDNLIKAHPESLRPVIGGVLRTQGLIGQLQGEESALYGKWRECCDKNGVFAITDADGVISVQEKELGDILFTEGYDTFLVRNEEKFGFPENLMGSIGIIVDEKGSNSDHRIIRAGEKIGEFLEGSSHVKSPFTSSSLMHAFIIVDDFSEKIKYLESKVSEYKKDIKNSEKKIEKYHKKINKKPNKSESELERYINKIKECEEDINDCKYNIVYCENEINTYRDKVKVVESAGDGLVKATLTLGKDKDFSHMLIYRPQDESFRAHISAYSTIAVADVEASAVSKYDRNKTTTSVLKKNFQTMEVKEKRVLAAAVADMLEGKKIHDKTGDVKKFFCSSFVTSIMQVSFVIQNLSDQQLNTFNKLSREEVEEEMFKIISLRTSSLYKKIDKNFLFKLRPDATTPAGLGRLVTNQ